MTSYLDGCRHLYLTTAACLLSGGACRGDLQVQAGGRGEREVWGWVWQELQPVQEDGGVPQWLQEGRLQADCQGEMLQEEGRWGQVRGDRHWHHDVRTLQSLWQEGGGDLWRVQAGGLWEGPGLPGGTERRGGLPSKSDGTGLTSQCYMLHVTCTALL